jgi:hypothetical protein
MAAGVLPKPGTTAGPCKGSCKHVDCADTRERAASKCLYCRLEVGFGVRIYQHGDYTVHARCHEEAAENGVAMF